MKVRLGVDAVANPVADLRDRGLDADAVLAAIRALDDQRVACPPPGPAHDHVGHVHPDAELSLRRALAAAARSRGDVAPQDEELATARERLAELAADPPPDLAAARRRVATAGADEDELRERVARLGGRLQERREAGKPTAELEREYRDAARALAEVETERVAAEQALARARRAARAARDARERRLRLQDRLDNLASAAREHLARGRYDEFRAAVERAPGSADPGHGPDEFAGETATAALAVARVASLSAPVVVEGLGAAAARAVDGPALVL